MKTFSRFKPNSSGLRDAIGDTGNTLMAVVFSFSALSLVELGGVFVEGWSLSNAVWTSGTGLALTWASVFAFATVMASYGINNKDYSDFTEGQSYVTYATVALIALLSLSSGVQGMIAGTKAYSVITFIVLVVGYGAIAGLDQRG